MVQDRDFKTMLDEREAGKTRGPPASSHFAKMQNSTVWGVKPNLMGEDKDWVMPKEIPKAKTKGDDKEHVEKTDKNNMITEPDETPSSKNKATSPLNAEGLVRKSDDSVRDKRIDATNNLSEKGFNDAEAANMAGLGASEKYSGVGHLDESASHDKDGKEVGETVSSRKSAFGTEVKPFRDMMKEH